MCKWQLSAWAVATLSVRRSRRRRGRRSHCQLSPSSQPVKPEIEHGHHLHPSFLTFNISHFSFSSLPLQCKPTSSIRLRTAKRAYTPFRGTRRARTWTTNRASSLTTPNWRRRPLGRHLAKAAGTPLSNTTAHQLQNSSNHSSHHLNGCISHVCLSSASSPGADPHSAVGF